MDTKTLKIHRKWIGLILCPLFMSFFFNACKTPTETAPGSFFLTIIAVDQVIPEQGGSTQIIVDVRDQDALLAGDGIMVTFVASLGEIPNQVATKGGIARALFKSTG
ncbi:hypothetical protein ACFLU6_13820, partial [Acidobacteriota bacterium]